MPSWYFYFCNCNFCKNKDELEKYKILYQAYADEIKNLWQRSAFLAVFMTLAWGGYGALQLKFITRECEKFDVNFYHLASLGLCGVIIVLSLLWVAMAKGSKFVQEAHEEHMKNLKFDELALMDLNTKKIQRLFCDFDIYETQLSKSNKLSANLLLPCSQILKAYRYSPSKINIALGWVSLFVAFVLCEIHIVNFSQNKLCFILPLALLIFLCIAMHLLKGGDNEKGKIMKILCCVCFLALAACAVGFGMFMTDKILSKCNVQNERILSYLNDLNTIILHKLNEQNAVHMLILEHLNEHNKSIKNIQNQANSIKSIISNSSFKKNECVNLCCYPAKCK